MPPKVHKERPHRDFLQIPDFSAKEIERLFSLERTVTAYENLFEEFVVRPRQDVVKSLAPQITEDGK